MKHLQIWTGEFGKDYKGKSVPRNQDKIKTRDQPRAHVSRHEAMLVKLFGDAVNTQELDKLGDGLLFELLLDVAYGGSIASFIRDKLGVKVKITDKVEGNLTRLIIWLPKSSFEPFIDLWRKFGKERKKENKSLDVALLSVESVQLAALKSLYLGPEDYYPVDEEKSTWWEVWMPRSRFADLQAASRQAGFQIQRHPLHFSNNSVYLVKASPGQITRAKLIRYLSEIRKPQFSVGFLMQVDAADAKAYQESALVRISQEARRVPVVLIDGGVNADHPLLLEAGAVRQAISVHAPTTADTRNHGTGVASLIVYGEHLADFIDGELHDFNVEVIIDSVSPLQVGDSSEFELYGSSTVRGCLALAERDSEIFVCTLTSGEPLEVGLGVADSYSAALDLFACGLDATSFSKSRPTKFGKVLIVQSAGNAIDDSTGLQHNDPSRRVHSPAQSWNSLVIGAYTKLPKGNIGPLDVAVAPGSLSTYTTGGFGFEARQPLVPDVVFEGGNTIRIDGRHQQHDDLSLLAANSRFQSHPYSTMWGTSAAAALGGRFCALLRKQYPDYWPETIRALVVNSARWTDQMLKLAGPNPNKTAMTALVQQCGFGVPSFKKAAKSAKHRVTMIREAELQPFKGSGSEASFHEIHLIPLPWPEIGLRALSELAGSEPIQLRVTLSYFVEPNPSRVTLLTRYRYESCGLRWRMQRPTESVKELYAAVSADTGETPMKEPPNEWQIGTQGRHRGSIHSDIWIGSGAELADMKHIAVYPTSGWWRSRKTAGRQDEKLRYSLIISLEAPKRKVNLYQEIASLLEVEIAATVNT